MRRVFCIILITFAFIKANCQSSPPNLPEFDEKLYHFGVSFGYSSLYSDMVSKVSLPFNDTIMGFYSKNSPGFTVGLSVALRLTSFLQLRFTPTLLLSERNIVYDVIYKGKYIERSNPLEVTYLEAPLEFKLQSKRWHNFRPYLLGGAKYVYDMASRKRKKLKPEEYLMKLENKEFMYTLGAGFDFYKMCKIGIELKTSFGLSDILDHSFNNAYTDCLDKIKTQVFYINITFE